MQLSGTEYLESLRDGRVLYLGSERVEDVTSHPAFRNAAGTFAKIQDALRDPANRDMLTYEEDGARHAFYWLKPRSREDLVWRWRAHRYVADLTYGMIGRTQDFYAGFVTALAMQPEALDTGSHRFGANVVAYYEHLRDNDLFICNAVTPPPGIRQRESFVARGKTLPAVNGGRNMRPAGGKADLAAATSNAFPFDRGRGRRAEARCGPSSSRISPAVSQRRR